MPSLTTPYHTFPHPLQRDLEEQIRQKKERQAREKAEEEAARAKVGTCFHRGSLGRGGPREMDERTGHG